MKNKFVSSLAIAAILLTGSSSYASAASSNYNHSEDTEPHVVNYSSGGVMVQYPMNAHIEMDSRVDYPGKILAYESLYARIKYARTFPFPVSLTADTIKYYKDGNYLSTHTLTTNESYLSVPQDLAVYKSNKPNSNFADDSTHKAVGLAVYLSTKTFPASYVIDTTEAVVH